MLAKLELEIPFKKRSGWWCWFDDRIFLKNELLELSITLCALICFSSSVTRVTSRKSVSEIRLWNTVFVWFSNSDHKKEWFESIFNILFRKLQAVWFYWFYCLLILLVSYWLNFSYLWWLFNTEDFWRDVTDYSTWIKRIILPGLKGRDNLF